MFIVRIWEGLGNQLFQYAYAKSLYERTGKKVYLDIRHPNRGDFRGEKKDVVTRKIGLQHFCVSLPLIDTRKISCVRWFFWKKLSDEQGVTHFYEEIFSPSNYAYISGHFIHKNYFLNCRETLLREFTLKRTIEMSESLKNLFETENTVAVHIRLTDYLMHTNALCRADYYRRAFRHIEEHVSEPKYIIFTDDIREAKKRYNLPEDAYWIGEDGYADYEELILMSMCRHNIMAASTFSFWGAWLNQNEEKIVVAPKKWGGCNLYQEGWKTI